MLFRKNVIEKSFINWRVLPLVKINIYTYFRYTLYISATPCILKIISFVENQSPNDVLIIRVRQRVQGFRTTAQNFVQLQKVI
jgi:hypothetical protein